MSSLLSYHIFSFFISNIFENFKFGRNFSKFTAGMDCRLVAVSVKIGGNRRLPIGKENTGRDTPVGRKKKQEQKKQQQQPASGGKAEWWSPSRRRRRRRPLPAAPTRRTRRWSCRR